VTEEDIRAAREQGRSVILVVDASVALKWFLHVADSEPDRDRALTLLAGVDDEERPIGSAAYFIAEVAAGCLRVQSRNAAEDDLLDLLNVERSTIDTPETYATALALSMRYRHHLFDTLYHAVACTSRAPASLPPTGATMTRPAARAGNPARRLVTRLIDAVPGRTPFCHQFPFAPLHSGVYNPLSVFER